MLSAPRAFRLIPLRRALLACGLLLALGLASARASSPPLVPGDSTGKDLADPAEAAVNPAGPKWQGIVIPTGANFPRLTTISTPNPRLYFTADDLPDLRGRAGLAGGTPVSDPRGFLTDRWLKIKADADYWLTHTPPDEDDRATAAKACAFVWQLTQTTTYRDRAITLLKAAFGTIDSDDNLVSHQLTNYAAAYDWVATDASPTDRTAILDRLKPGADAAYAYLKTGARSHNHRSKSGAALVSWALAVGPYTSGATSTQTYFDYGIDQGLRRVWRYMFTPDGVYRDGAGYYWVYQIFQTTPVLYQLKRLLGTDLFPTLQPAFEWQLKTSTIRGWTPPIEDGAYKQLWLVSVAGAYRDTPATAFHPTATLGEVFQWRYFNTDNAPVRYPTTRNDSDSWNGAPGSAYTWPDEFIFYAPDVAAVAPDSAHTTFDFTGGGQGGPTVLRTDWNVRSRATRWVYFEGTPMSNNHDHADALQVLFDAEDSILLSDNGYGPNKFSQRAAWAPATEHNVVTKVVAGNEVALGDPAPSRNVLNTSFFRCAEKTAGYFDAPATDQLSRFVALAGEDYLAVIDRTSAPAVRTWRSRWYGRGTLSGAGKLWKWTNPASSNWGQNAELHALLLPGDSVTPTYTSNTFNPYQSTLENRPSVRLDRTGASSVALALFSPSAAGASDDAVLTELAPSPSTTLGAQLSRNGYIDRWLTASSAGPLAQGDLSAQARLLWWRERTSPSSVQQCALIEGTEIRRSGDLVLSASRAVTVALDFSTAGTTRLILASDASDAPVTFTLPRPSGKTAVATFDAASVPVTQDDATVSLTLSAADAGELVVTWVTPPPVPQFNPAGGTFTSVQTVTLIAEAGMTIRYTLDGSLPTLNTGLVYTSPLTLTSTTTINAIACTEDAASDVVSATYTIDLPPVDAPEISLAGGTFTSTQVVTLTTSLPDAIIRYTLDGSDPDSSHGLVYTDPLVIATTTTLCTVVVASDGRVSAFASATYVITPVTPAAPGRIVNLSIRSRAGTGANALIVGFVLQGDGNQKLLLRGVGPALVPLGVTDALADPMLRLFRAYTPILENNDWGNDPAVDALSSELGAFALPADGKDAALAATLGGGAGGVYTAQITGVDGTTGIALAEIYDAHVANLPQLVNVSARTQVGTGADILISGFVIAGETPVTVLVRGVGPGLYDQFDLAGVLANPRLTLFRDGVNIADNDDWGGDAALAATFTTVGAFSLRDDSQDAALLATLPPGVYTAQVAGVGGTTGIALVEVYLVPAP